MATTPKTTDQADELVWGDVDPTIMERILKENWWVNALRGALGILFGVIALFFPVATILSLVLLFSAYMLVDGAFSIVGAIRAGSKGEQWGWLLTQGIVSLITGVLAFLWPGITALAFVMIIAAWAIVSGSLQLAAAFRIRRRERGRGWLIFSGIISILFGVLLVIAPLIGAIVLTWWVGAYVLVSSLLLLIVAFSVRSGSPRKKASQGAGSTAPRPTG
jgi:uncharacterized membrane protein HdeD (DUF308 family)